MLLVGTDNTCAPNTYTMREDAKQMPKKDLGKDLLRKMTSYIGGAFPDWMVGRTQGLEI